jgi:hypothetical protein
VRDLGNARLLTMRGDGHTAYDGQSACIDQDVEAYLIDGTLPPVGTQCTQEIGFNAPQVQRSAPAAPAADIRPRGVPSAPLG